MNTFKFIWCSKNDVRVHSMFYKMVFDTSLIERTWTCSSNSNTQFFASKGMDTKHVVLPITKNQFIFDEWIFSSTLDQKDKTLKFEPSINKATLIHFSVSLKLNLTRLWRLMRLIRVKISLSENLHEFNWVSESLMSPIEPPCPPLSPLESP